MSAPRLRPHLRADADGDRVVLTDPYRIADPFALTRLGFEIVRRFDGTRTSSDIARQLRGGPDLVAAIDQLAAQLDAGLVLDSPAFHDYLAGPVRRPVCVGVYPDDPAAIRTQLDGLFRASGLPAQQRSPVRAVLVPHMDYARGNVTYGWGFKEIAERTDATLFVIVATSHYSPERFTLTRMNFRTPLGTVATDQAYLDRIEAAYGPGLYTDRFAHFPEHSIELEVVLLQHVFPDRPLRIVPLLVGSFHDCVQTGRSPAEMPDIARMVAALKAAEAAAGEPVCYVVSGDLAHIGPKFDDPDPVDEPQLAASRRQDEKLLACLESCDADGYFRVIAAEQDERRICGLPPTWLTLAATGATTGSVLHYQQFVHPAGHESVSFAAVGFQ